MTTQTPHPWPAEGEPDPAHLAECAACRAEDARLRRVDAALEAVTAEPTRRFGTLAAGLPIAPWEGAGHRAWGVVAALLAFVTVVAGALFVVGGVSPMEGVRETARVFLWGRAAVADVSGSFGTLVHGAPRGVQVAVGLGFLAVNALLVAMLRRGPKGYDVRSR